MLVKDVQLLGQRTISYTQPQPEYRFLAQVLEPQFPQGSQMRTRKYLCIQRISTLREPEGYTVGYRQTCHAFVTERDTYQ